MRLSEAIRLGSMLRPVQEFQVLFDPESGGSCALGAAGEAIGLLDLTRRNQWVAGKRAPQSWLWAATPEAQKCPAVHCESDWHACCSAQELIIHLNNHHRWTREQIADWVQTIEPAQVDSEAERAVTADGLQAVHALVEATK